MPRTQALIRRVPDPGFVQPLKSVFVSQDEREGATKLVVPNVPCQYLGHATVGNPPDSNQPSKIRRYENPQHIHIDQVA